MSNYVYFVQDQVTTFHMQLFYTQKSLNIC